MHIHVGTHREMSIMWSLVYWVSSGTWWVQIHEVCSMMLDHLLYQPDNYEAKMSNREAKTNEENIYALLPILDER